MMVKICGITRREDAEAAVQAGASALGFIFYDKSPRYVPPSIAAQLADGLDTLKVGVFVNESPARIESVMREARLDVAQVYGGAEAILLDGPANGIARDWAAARGVAPKIILAGGLDASNVADAIRAARPWGVDASSRLETSPGIKDHEKVRACVKAAREAK
jgi:phosphoribosylanthranilate isomerase